MLPIAGSSRRALFAVALATVPAVGTAKRKKKHKRKPKPPAPVAFVAAVITGVAPAANGGFRLTSAGTIRHPAAGFATNFGVSVDVAVEATPDAVRKAVVSRLRSSASMVLYDVDTTVTADRIAVVLL